MSRASQPAKFGSSLTGEAGFTLVELLIAMVISVVVLGAATFGLGQAFSQSTQASARTSSAGQAEAGLERLVLDLRFAMSCPTYNGSNTLGVSGQPVSGLLLSAGPRLQLCEPTAASHAAGPPAIALVNWTCNTASATETCTRSTTAVLCPTSGGTTAATGACSLGAPSLSATVAQTVSVNGISGFVLSGVVSGASQASLLTDTTCQISAGIESYGLTSGSTCPVSWVGVRAQVVPLADPNNPTDTANSRLSHEAAIVQVQTGTELENYSS